MSHDETRIGRPQPLAPQAPALARLTIRASPDARAHGTSYELRGADVLLGRSEDNTIPVNDPNVSRHHARVFRQDGADWLVDMNSANGTLVNGASVRQVRLSKGDVILMGSTAILYEPL